MDEESGAGAAGRPPGGVTEVGECGVPRGLVRLGGSTGTVREYPVLHTRALALPLQRPVDPAAAAAARLA